MAHTTDISRSVRQSGDMLRIRQEPADGHVLVRVAGEVDLATAGDLAGQLRRAQHAVVPPAPVVLDLEEVDFLGSAGLVVLVQEAEACQERGIPLRIVSSSRSVLRSIGVTGLDKVLTVAPTLREALAFA
ncbi:STAS domain-containing protein [Amycolatopsis sp.]|uniref:STAS domain-containing protein n=1 Tax=Amycolatopsis sp. TaxID=37632 RepID=UPI002B994FC6|nr:STAS domain-containing protein [Amycolatopsis sp.]HVV14563.1 STAS domain-containing protein [Amycolatopsis sp.]